MNAKAVAEYIMHRNPQTVSLVCMGNGGIRPAKEDELCAESISLMRTDRMYSRKKIFGCASDTILFRL